jgi:putative mRNA 3-end processing factor
MTDSPAAAIARWLYPTEGGLYCAAGDFYIDPLKPADRAVITHGHSDHARPGHARVLATPATLAIMRARLGAGAGVTPQPLAYGERLTIGDVSVRLVPAGHVFGSAQVVLEHQGLTAVVSGDYKRAADPTAAPFELTRCHVFVSEATFGLPVFRHEPAEREIAKLIVSTGAFPDRTHLVGAYGLGKCQRIIALLRQAGWDRPIWLHGAMVALCRLYAEHGIDLGDLKPVSEAGKDKLAGEIVLAPPSALADRWSRRLADPLTVYASGWMRVRGRARQQGVELPLVISDHADWPELLRTVEETEAEEIWVTHGREDALVRQLALMGRRGRALALVGFEDEAE